MVVIHVGNFRVVPRGISCGTRLAQRVVHAADAIALALEHERYIACVFHAASLTANAHVGGLSEIGEFSRVYASNQSDVIVNCACAALTQI